MQLNPASGTINALPRQIAAHLFCVMLTYVTSKKAKLFDFPSDSDDDKTETTDSDAHLAVECYKSEPEEVDQDTCLLQ